jgi:rubrerythrin
MKLNPKSKPDEVLALGIKSEIDAADLYAILRSRVKNILLQQKLDFLAVEEKQHRKILERLFKDRFGDRTPALPSESFLSKTVLPQAETLTVKELFDAALKAEKVSEDFYKEAAASAEEDASRRMLTYLSRVERSHYFMIESEVNLLATFPDYYKVEDFHIAQDMIHVGP